MINKYSEYDVVKACRDLSANVCAGTRGTVLLVFADTPPHYEVEFMNDGESLDVFTVSENDIHALAERK